MQAEAAADSKPLNPQPWPLPPSGVTPACHSVRSPRGSEKGTGAPAGVYHLAMDDRRGS